MVNNWQTGGVFSDAGLGEGERFEAPGARRPSIQEVQGVLGNMRPINGLAAIMLDLRLAVHFWSTLIAVVSGSGNVPYQWGNPLRGMDKLAANPSNATHPINTLANLHA
jgi:hypothetical protein